MVLVANSPAPVPTRKGKRTLRAGTARIVYTNDKGQLVIRAVIACAKPIIAKQVHIQGDSLVTTDQPLPDCSGFCVLTASRIIYTC